MQQSLTEFLVPRRIGFLTPSVQVILVALLYIATTLVGYAEYKSSRTMFGYPLAISILFVPIYEEMIFRGFILKAAEDRMKWMKAIALTSLLFALWHFKNIFFLPPGRLIYQMLYAGLIISPVLSYITLKTRTIWPGIILHYLINLMIPVTSVMLSLAYHV